MVDGVNRRKIAPLAAEGVKCTFHTFEKNTSGLQYICLVMTLSIVYECTVSNQTS